MCLTSELQTVCKEKLLDKIGGPPFVYGFNPYLCDTYSKFSIYEEKIVTFNYVSYKE